MFRFFSFLQFSYCPIYTHNIFIIFLSLEQKQQLHGSGHGKSTAGWGALLDTQVALFAFLSDPVVKASTTTLSAMCVFDKDPDMFF